MSFAVAAFIFWMAVMGRSLLHNLFGFFVTLTLAVQAYGNWGSGNLNAIKIAGWIGILTALVALYMAAKALINDEYEKVILP
jgi:succinate-acetate transporter protein